MDVLGHAVGGRPVVVDVQAHAVCAERPLGLQVGGGGDDDQPAPLVAERPAGARQGERGLSGAGRGDGEEVLLFAGGELVEGFALPLAELDTVAHGNHRVCPVTIALARTSAGNSPIGP